LLHAISATSAAIGIVLRSIARPSVPSPSLASLTNSRGGGVARRG
jgi:hypothetical protein